MDESIIKKLDDFFAQYPVQDFKKGDILIQAGIEPKGIYYVVSGIIRSYWISQDGTEVTLNMYKPHTFLPMSWAIAGVKNVQFYEAIIAGKVRRAPKKDVLKFLKMHPDILFDLLRRIYVGMEGLWTHIESLTTGGSYEKLIATLTILAKRFGKNDKTDTVVQLKVTERDIANYAGMSRETTSRELQKLKKEKLVSFIKGFLTVHDLQKLEDILQ